MKKYRLLSWNVNGIRAIAKKGFLEWFGKEKPDILCIQETKAWKEQLDDSLINIGEYKSYFAEAYKKGYSGVATYTKEEPLNISFGIGIEHFDREGRFVITEHEKFTLMNIYYPNGKRDDERLKYKMDFYEAFQEYAVDLKNKGKKLIICGDVNTAHKEIDLARPKENRNVSGFLPQECEWIDRFLARGFIDTLRMFNQNSGVYTWWDMISRARERNVGWRIDYFYISENLKNSIADAFTMPDVMGSDHCPVGIEINL
ncbi:MAG: exodeoxyribonuclease III [Melioribacteraceae bacterium]|nr:exodeoxyribonuclease III [Melioribacteraceae bacterium]